MLLHTFAFKNVQNLAHYVFQSFKKKKKSIRKGKRPAANFIEELQQYQILQLCSENISVWYVHFTH